MSRRSNGIILRTEVESQAAGRRATPQSKETAHPELSRDRMAFGPAGTGPLETEQFARDEASSSIPSVSGAPDGPILGARQFNDDQRGGVGIGGIQDLNPDSMGNGGMPERNTGASGAGSIQDRMQARSSAKAYADRYQGGAGGPSTEDRYEGKDRGGFERDRLDLPEDMQWPAVHPHRVTHQRPKTDESLRQVPSLVYQTVELLQDIAGLSKRITAIATETADIRRQLPPILGATATKELPIKVTSRLRKKLPK